MTLDWLAVLQLLLATFALGYKIRGDIEKIPEARKELRDAIAKQEDHAKQLKDLEVTRDKLTAEVAELKANPSDRIVISHIKNSIVQLNTGLGSLNQSSAALGSTLHIAVGKLGGESTFTANADLLSIADPRGSLPLRSLTEQRRNKYASALRSIRNRSTPAK